MAIQAGGAGALDVNAIVSQLMQLERRPLELLAREADRYGTRISAYGSLKSALASFQGALKALEQPEKILALKASVGDTALASASAGSGAAEGSYSLRIDVLAQQHKLKSGVFASALDAVGTGTLTFQYGTDEAGVFTLNPARAAQPVAIGAGQNTLAGIRDAVNAARIGVTAGIVNDGSGERLVFTSTESGAANSLRVSVSDDDGTHGDAAGLSQLAYDPAAAAGAGKNLAQAVAARDASFALDGIAITRASNTVTDAIAGVTLNLLAEAPATTTTLTVAKDRKAVSDAVDGFVKAYNALLATLGTLTAYNAASRKGGTLQGDSVALGVLSRVKAVLSGAVASGGTLTTLSQIGVAFQKDGRLALDAAKLDKAIDGNLADIAALFAAAGTPSDARVAYAGAAAATRAGRYAIQVTQAPTRGALAGSAAAGLTISAGVNDALSFAVDGAIYNVVLSAGSYASASALALELQTRLNGALQASGTAVTVGVSGGALTVTSARYGTGSAVTAGAGAGATSLLGETPVSQPGLDAAGTIGGLAATGSGQQLSAAGGDAEGLKVKLLSAASGDLGTVRFSRGIAAQLVALADELLADDGAIDARVSGLNASVKANGLSQTRLEERLQAVEKRLRAQFTALDQALARMSSTSAYLEQQLASLPKP
jgi:flagellar hook-associated protein 2